MRQSRYAQWPFAWREVAAEAVTRWCTAPRRHITSATISSIPSDVVRGCVEADLNRASIHPDKYNDAQRGHLEKVGRVLGAVIPPRKGVQA